MHRLALFVAACVGIAAVAAAAEPPIESVQGLYEGACKDAKGEHKLEARVVACGKGTYKVFVRQPLADGKVAKVELDGKVEGDALRFARTGDVAWAAAYADGTLTGTCGQGCTLQAKRIVRESPTLGVKPPAGAIVLLDGKNFDEVTKKPLKDGKEQEWKPVDGGGIEVPKGGLTSKQKFDGSFKLHVEFKCPLVPDGRGQGRGNSGVYLPNGSEIQVLDSFGMTTYTGGGCGGLYKYKDPDAFDEFSLASAPPLQWQTYDVEYRVEKKDGNPPASRASRSSTTASRSTTTPSWTRTPSRSPSPSRTTATPSTTATSGSCRLTASSSTTLVGGYLRGGPRYPYVFSAVILRPRLRGRRISPFGRSRFFARCARSE